MHNGSLQHREGKVRYNIGGLQPTSCFAVPLGRATCSWFHPTSSSTHRRKTSVVAANGGQSGDLIAPSMPGGLRGQLAGGFRLPVPRSQPLARTLWVGGWLLVPVKAVPMTVPRPIVVVPSAIPAANGQSSRELPQYHVANQGQIVRRELSLVVALCIEFASIPQTWSTRPFADSSVSRFASAVLAA